MSTENEKRFAFHQFLQTHGIGGFSPSIPEGIGKHLNGVPFEDDLVKIPDMETFPLPEIEKTEKLGTEDMRAMFTQAQIIQSLFEENEEEDQKESNKKICQIDIPNQFLSEGHFIRFKKELNTYYINQSKNLGLSEEIHCCNEISCCNPCVPSFDYCINHLSKDPKFQNQKLLTKCSVEGCNNVCSAGVGVCGRHKNKR